MHARDVVHRDIKPENIVLIRNKNKNNKKEKEKEHSEIRLIDFGDATVADDNITFDIIVGTLSYLAPERFYHHKGWQLKASDMWAVGVVTFEMLTGKKCFNCENDEKNKTKNIKK